LKNLKQVIKLHKKKYRS